MSESLKYEDFQKAIEGRAKNTVGYMETQDKESYLIAVNTTTRLAWETVVSLQDGIKLQESERNAALQDIGLLVRTLNKYQFLTEGDPMEVERLKS